MSDRKAVVLLSGGLDSATSLAIAVDKGYECYCLSFDYGQRHGIEIQFAASLANSLGAVEHRIARIDIGAFGGSALTDSQLKYRIMSRVKTRYPSPTYRPEILYFWPVPLAGQKCWVQGISLSA